MGEQSRENSEQRILDAAESMIRSRGYNGFSFREVADAVGIKSSTVHYYFPTKDALGAAVAERYTERFLSALGSPEKSPPNADAVLHRLRKLFRNSLVKDKMMCLCGILGAEIADLPPAVAEQARSFFTRNTEWIVEALGGTDWGKNQNSDERRKVALKSIAVLEGALIVARALGKPSVFDDIEMDRLEK